jgi:hypothetical protein
VRLRKPASEQRNYVETKHTLIKKHDAPNYGICKEGGESTMTDVGGKVEGAGEEGETAPSFSPPCVACLHAQYTAVSVAAANAASATSMEAGEAAALRARVHVPLVVVR